MKRVILFTTLALIIGMSGCLNNTVEPFEEIEYEDSPDYENFLQIEEIDLDEVDRSVQVAMNEEGGNVYVQVRNVVPTGGYSTEVETVHVDDKNNLNVVFASKGPSEDEVSTQAIEEQERTVAINTGKVPENVDQVRVTLHDGWGNLHIVDFER